MCEELEYLDYTIDKYNEVIDDSKLKLNNLRELYKHNYEAMLEEKFRLESEINSIEKAKSNPYFARIDFKSKNFLDKCYIGKKGVTDYDNNVITVDWRAPISSLYYDSNVGECKYIAPEGIIEGNLLLKRQYTIEKGKLINFNDVDTVSNDELLKPYLSVSADNRLKNIVSTIQSEQNQIIREDMYKNLVIQGVAGSGKTTVALHRMSEITGREAKTIHRLLEVEWDKNDNPQFKHNMQDPLKADAVIVDELSMVDISLFSSLLNALPLGCRLIMVGDSDQLPAVGAGNVLHDLIDSETLPVVELKKVFRQAMKSRIVTNAHDIVEGKMPDLGTKDNDFFFMKRYSDLAVSNTITELCSQRLPKAYGYDPINDIQVLCPSRKGECGSINLNKRLQAVLNPPSRDKREVTLAGRVLREGDKVMQIKNNYDIIWTKGKEEGSGIFNGDIGVIEKIDVVSSAFSVNFEDRNAVYSFENANEIEHAYACTVHKSQGNEFKAVVMPVFNVIPNLCYRNLLYTAVTRAKSIMILVGSEDTVYKMTANNSRTKRYTALKHFLTCSEDEDEGFI